ncbi:MAG: hypothetical protein KKA41_11915 [Proteobacteria bacterium]|nr:hypothetical protein [Pseudomonadota bacterium]
MNLHQKIIVVITDVLLLAEVCVCMYLCSQQSPENLTPTFIKNFAMMCVPTLIGAKILITRLRSPEEAQGSVIADTVLIKK